MPDGRHGFKGVHDPEMVAQGLGVDVWRTRDGLLAHARNKGAGHALPTYVTPQIEIELSSAGGARRSHLIARRMRWSEHDGWTEIADDRLLPGQWIALSLALEPGERGWVRVRVDPAPTVIPLQWNKTRDRMYAATEGNSGKGHTAGELCL